MPLIRTPTLVDVSFALAINSTGGFGINPFVKGYFGTDHFCLSLSVPLSLSLPPSRSPFSPLVQLNQRLVTDLALNHSEHLILLLVSG